MRLFARSRIGRLLTVCAVCAMTAAAAGCGGGGKGSAGTTGEGGGNKLTPVRILDVAGIPSDYLIAGVRKGFFKRHGLDVTVKRASGGAAIIPAVVSGDAQFGGSNMVSVLLAATKGLPIEIVGPGTFGPDSKQDGWSAILVSHDSPIKKPKDLEGKTIAVNTLKNVASETVKASLDNLGVDISKVKFTEIGFPDMLAALDQGRVDAIFEIEPFVTAGLSAGDRRVVYPYYSTQPGIEIGSYVAREDYARKHPDVVKAFQAGLADTSRFVAQHPDEFRKVMAAEDVSHAKDLTLPTWKDAVSLDALKKHSSLMVKFGLINKPPPLDKVVAPGAAD
ncbi:MAG: ABC transporter substrate-binding protein [Streptosporangiaceae bacterium]